MVKCYTLVPVWPNFPPLVATLEELMMVQWVVVSRAELAEVVYMTVGRPQLNS
jgi:hypothetical protein